jgi:hypothetical protein
VRASHDTQGPKAESRKGQRFQNQEGAQEGGKEIGGKAQEAKSEEIAIHDNRSQQGEG